MAMRAPWYTATSVASSTTRDASVGGSGCCKLGLEEPSTVVALIFAHGCFVTQNAVHANCVIRNEPFVNRT